MVPHIELQQKKEKYLLLREEDKLLLLLQEAPMDRELERAILHEGRTLEEISALGLSCTVIQIADLDGVAIYDYAAGAELEFHSGKNKLCYQLARRCDPRELDRFFKGITRIQTPASRRAAGGKKGDWRAGTQTPEGRKQMRRIGIGANVVSILVTAGVLFLPWQLGLKFVASLLCAVAGVVLGVLHQEYFIFFDQKTYRKNRGKSPVTEIEYTFLPLMVLSIRAVLGYSYFALEQLLVYGSVLGLVVGFVLTALTKDLRDHLGCAACALFFAVIIGWGLVGHTNHLLARKPMQVSAVTVVDQHSSGGRTRSYYLTVVIPEYGELDLRVSRSVYNQYELGDSIWVSTRTGAWGLDYAMPGREE